MSKIFVAFDHGLNKKHADVVRKMLKDLNHQDLSVDKEIKIEGEEKNQIKKL